MTFTCDYCGKTYSDYYATQKVDGVDFCVSASCTTIVHRIRANVDHLETPYYIEKDLPHYDA